MVEESTIKKKKYVPVAVTAKKVGEIDGEDILKLDMPTERITERINDVDVTKEDNMVELTEAQIDKRVSEMIGKLKLQETIDKIAKRNEEINSKVSGIDEKLGESVEKYESKFDEIKKNQDEFRDKQEEVCTGVDCIKKDISKVDELKGEVGKLNEIVAAEYAKCSGPKGCNEDIKIGSSFCPNCGARISEWEGHPEWMPYWKRQR